MGHKKTSNGGNVMPSLQRSMRGLFSAALVTLGCVAALSPEAVAQQKIRFAYLKSTTLIPFFFAQEKGYFKAEGLDIELVAVPGGPAVAAAIAGGSADIGYAAPTPIAIARQQGQPYRFFIGMEREDFKAGLLWGTILASEKSSIKTLADLKGKKVMLGPPGGLCELSVREWVAKAGLKWEDITPLFNPFPQMQAALDVGNTDAACIIEPFTTAVQASAVKPVTLARGYLAEHPERYTVDGIFANEKWLAENPKAVASIKTAMLKAWQELAKDRPTVEGILDKEFRFPKALVDRIKIDFVAQIALVPADFEPIIARMKAQGMLKADFKAEDLILTDKK
jgi:NitT/TauT family transport system substrate-binding protein